MRTCVLFLVCPLPCVLCSLPRLTVLLPALPDVHLSAQREVQVQPPVRLPLGDRGHIRLRDTPHIFPTLRFPSIVFKNMGCALSKKRHSSSLEIMSEKNIDGDWNVD